MEEVSRIFELFPRNSIYLSIEFLKAHDLDAVTVAFDPVGSSGAESAVVVEGKGVQPTSLGCHRSLMVFNLPHRSFPSGAIVALVVIVMTPPS